MSRFTKVSVDGTLLPADASEFVALLDTTTGLMWSAANLAREGEVELDHAQAMQACLDCNESKLAGFGDWRAPTIEELFLLADRSLVNPAADPVLNMEPDWYWSSTAAAGWPAVAWDVHFGGGGAGRSGRGSYARVRAVRVASQ